jgi:hypothetical protein
MWSVLWWPYDGAEMQILHGVSWEKACERRDWCNSLKFPIVAVVRAR